MRAGIISLVCVLAVAACRAGERRIIGVEAVEYREKTIYHSPETPGYSAWVALWRCDDRRICCSFRQLTGPAEQPATTYPVLESTDERETWRPLQGHVSQEVAGGGGIYQVGTESYRGMEVLQHGKVLVRPVWPAAEMDETGYVVRSSDGGRTWSDRIDLMPRTTWRVWPTLIRKLHDGRLVLMAGCWRRGEKIASGDGPMRKVFFLSRDGGKTWGEAIPLLTPGQGTCEESDFCELPGGDLFWVHRSEFYPDQATEAPPGACRMGATPPQSNWYSIRNQSITRKDGKMFIPEAPTLTGIPHSGFPLVLRTREGVILHLGTNGIHWTADVGKTWHLLKVPGTAYYPKGLQCRDGRILVIGHVGSDDVYGKVDQSIRQQSFRLKITRD